jgi:hypothetical protein
MFLVEYEVKFKVLKTFPLKKALPCHLLSHFFLLVVLRETQFPQNQYWMVLALPYVEFQKCKVIVY